MAERTVARDLDTTTALDDPDWLHVFSTRLNVDDGRSVRPWVRYR
jgi:hypothetical protein